MIEAYEPWFNNFWAVFKEQSQRTSEVLETLRGNKASRPVYLFLGGASRNQFIRKRIDNEIQGVVLRLNKYVRSLYVGKFGAY